MMKELIEKGIFGLLSIMLMLGCKPYESVQPLQSMQDLQYPYEVQYVELEAGNSVAYIDEGKGNQTLVFIHGLGSYLPAWKRNIEQLKSQYRCVAIDLPGYGKSDKGDYDYSMKYFASTVAEVLEILKIDNATIVGHSMGGQIAMTMALYHTEVVENLVLVAPAGFETFHEGQKEWFKNTVTPRLIKLTSAEGIQTNLAYNFYDYPEEAKFMIEDRLAMRSAEDFEWYCYAIAESVAAMVNDPVFEYLDEIKAPTLVIFGKNDNLIPNRYLNPGPTIEIAQSGASQLSNATLKMINKCGHFAQFEKPEEVNQTIESFLSK